MLNQCEGDKILLLLPAWPPEWDVDFKLHAPKNTTVECEVKDGSIVKLVVMPVSRREDVETARHEVVPGQPQGQHEQWPILFSPGMRLMQ